MSMRALKTMAKRGWHRSFRLLQRAGVNLLPKHFYSGIPNLADLERRTDWRRPRTMYGINQSDVDEQVALLGEWLGPHADLLRSRSIHREAFVGGGASAFQTLNNVIVLRRSAPEFYGRVMEWHTKWSNDMRTMYHVNYYRWPFLPKIRNMAKKMRMKRASPESTGTPQES